MILSVRSGSARLGPNVSFVAGGMEAYTGAPEKLALELLGELHGRTSRKGRPRTLSIPIS
jgi:hypothetical protein